MRVFGHTKAINDRSPPRRRGSHNHEDAVAAMRNITFSRLGSVAFAWLALGANAQAAESEQGQLGRIVAKAIEPVMKENDVLGMAVAVTIKGKRYFFNYGVASKESGQKVTENTIFEIGSISKTFTATLAAYAQRTGTMALSDPAVKYMPALAGSALEKVSLLDLGTYAAGGLPLQFPDSVKGQDGIVAFFKSWRPDYAAGTYRQYSNPSIGLFGELAAKSMGKPFADLMEQKLFPAFGLTSTFIKVPESRMADYAFGYSKADKPIRVSSGPFGSEAYGVKTTSTDMARYLELNMDSSSLDAAMKGAIVATHTGYYKVDNTTQGLGWETYSYPTTLDVLLAGNSSDMALKPHKVERLVPPQEAGDDVLINKTGSTNGFGAYAVFVPAEKIGIVMLANKSYPNPIRVKAAYQIITAIEKQPGLLNAR